MRWFLYALLVASLGMLTTRGQAGDFPQFRGPSGQGHSAETGLPLRWSESENIAWKAPVPGRGWSSPAIAGQQAWLTTAVEAEGRLTLRALCFDCGTGDLLTDVEVFQIDSPGSIHDKNSHASPTPVLEGDRVYVHFGAHGTACLQRDGAILWKTRLEYDHRHGPGGSPVLAGQLLCINCDGYETQFVVALDKLTGQQVWRAAREDGRHAYSTPLVIEVDGRQQLVSVGGEWAVAYEPSSGEKIWQVRYPGGYSNVPRPVFGHGLVFLATGYNTPVLLAIRPTGQGDVTETHVAWRLERGAPLNPSPLLVDDQLYIVSDNGILTCLDPRSGETYWRQRVEGNYSASPVFADGRVYLLNEEGRATVFQPDRQQFRELAVNTLPGRTLASVAVADQALLLRTSEALYRIQELEAARSD